MLWLKGCHTAVQGGNSQLWLCRIPSHSARNVDKALHTECEFVSRKLSHHTTGPKRVRCRHHGHSRLRDRKPSRSLRHQLLLPVLINKHNIHTPRAACCERCSAAHHTAPPPAHLSQPRPTAHTATSPRRRRGRRSSAQQSGGPAHAPCRTFSKQDTGNESILLLQAPAAMWIAAGKSQSTEL